MQAELEFLEHLDGGGWWLRFRSRSTPTFQATKEQLKTLIAWFCCKKCRRHGTLC